MIITPILSGFVMFVSKEKRFKWYKRDDNFKYFIIYVIDVREKLAV